MAHMLKFRKGTFAQINAAPKAAGTIYIAKDEKAMYVDVDASTRIRIGDFIRVASIDDIPQPYSETAVYYVEGANALLGYKDGNWKQINGTEELVTRIEAVEGDVATNKANIATNTADISTLKTDVSDLKTTVGTHGTDIEALKAAVGMDDEGNVEGLAGSVAALREDLTELETEVHGTNGNGGMVATLADHTSRIATLEGKDVALKSDVSAAKTAVLGQADGGADFNGTVKGAYEAAATAQTQANKGVADAAAAQSTADANAQSISSLTNRVKALDDATTGEVPLLKSRVQTLENAGYATVTQVNEAKNAVLGTEADAAGAATVHGALKSAAAAKSAADAAAEAAAAAQGDIDAWETAHASDYINTKIDELVAAAKKAGDDAQADFDAYETAHANDYTNKQIDDKITTVTNAASAAKSAADDAQADATQALADAAAANTNANNRVSKTEFATFQTSNTAAIADAKKAGTDAGTQAETNRQAIATLQGTVNKLNGDVNTDGSVKKQIKDATDALQTSLESKIDEEINAANAMEYKEGISSQTDLNAIDTSKAKVGDTYVITAAFGTYKPGDLLIATGTETNGVITSNFSWTHVKTGYDASLEQKLETVDGKIQLTSIAAANNGTIEFKADSDSSASVSVTKDATNSSNSIVTIGMVWEDFDE